MQSNNGNPDSPKEPRKSRLPDCVECDGCATSGSGCASGGGCASNGCGGCHGSFRGEPRGKLYASDWLDDISTSADFPAVQVQFKNTRSAFYSNPQKLNLEIGDIVAVEAAPGHDIGQVTMVGPLVRMQMIKAKVDPEKPEELKKVFRKARPSDLERFDEARAREHDTMIRSRRIAEELGLNMKIGDVEYQGDGGKAIFYYIADERVDFRKLIRLLADEFKVRIEMKQIGARQEAGRIGGIGPCGRPLCCSSWMTNFVSVGTGAARQQDLSMNPQKLAGQCAKLKCCLNFEIDTYAEASRKLPPKDEVLYTKEQDYYHFKVDILSRMVTYSTDRKMAVGLVTIPASRAFEVIALNKQGIKPDELLVEEAKEPVRQEFIDLTDQDDLTRFDKTRRRKKQKKAKGRQEQPETKNSRPAKEQASKPKEQTPRPKEQPREQAQKEAKEQKGRNQPRKNGRDADRARPVSQPHDRRKANPPRRPQQQRQRKQEDKG